MTYSLRKPTPADATAVSALVQAVFAEFIAPDWEAHAQAVFAIESSAERFTELLVDPAFAAVAEDGESLVGFILLPTPSLLAFFFVEGRLHKQGVGKALWQAARSHIELAFPGTKTVELNSSPSGFAAYKALGFYPISEPFRRGGCVATRMACWLPGRSLAQASDAA